VEAGEFHVAAEPLAVAEAFRTCTRLMAERATKAGVALRATSADRLTVMADPLRLKQILINLVSNAVKFTPAGGHITLAAQPAGADTVEITVSDTGPGIAPEDIERVLAPYGQAQAGRTDGGGTGLGLPLARALAQAHGGQLDLESTPGAGTTVRLLLPTPDGALAAAAAASGG
jgi:signal transduction histidine kinase